MDKEAGHQLDSLLDTMVDNVDTMVDSLLDMARGQRKPKKTLQTKSLDSVGNLTKGRGNI